MSLPEGLLPVEPPATPAAPAALPEGLLPLESPAPDPGAEELQKDSAIKALFDASLATSGDDHAAALTIGEKLKVPASLVAERLPEFKRAAEAAKFDPRTFRRDSPELAAFLLDRPAMAPVIRDDSANLTGLEWALTGRRRVMLRPDGSGYTEETLPFWASVLRDAVHQSELALRQTLDLQAASAERLSPVPTTYDEAGKGVSFEAEGQTYNYPPGLEPQRPTGPPAPYSPENTARQQELAGQVPSAKDYGIGEIKSAPARWVAQTLADVIEFVPMMGGAIGAAALGGAAAGPVGAFGALYGFNYVLSAGPEYAAKRAVLDASGKAGDPTLEDEAIWAATLGGSVNAGLMSVGTGPIVRGIGAKLGLGKLLSTGAVKTLVQDETIGRVIRRGALEYGTHFAQGLSTLVAMTGVSTALQEKYSSDVTGDAPQYSRVGEAMLATAKDQAAAMLVLSGMSLPVRKYIEEIGRARALDRNAGRLTESVKAAQESKAIGQMPEAAGELVQRMAAVGDAGTVMVEKAEFDRLYQAANVSPRDVAAEFMGDGGRAYDQAAATGGDIPVPAQVFLTKMARSKVGLELADISRLPQDSRTPRQTREVAARIGAKIREQAEAAVKEGNPTPHDAIFEDFKAKSMKAGLSELQAKTNAEVVARAFTWFGAQAGRDPVEVYRTEMPVEVFGPRKAGEPAPGGLPQDPIKVEISPSSLPSKSKKGDGTRGTFDLHYDADGKPVKGELHLADPDPSTMPHETMHWFTEVLQKLAEKPDAGADLKDHFQVLLRAMGYSSPRERSVAGAERRQLQKLDKPNPAESTRLKHLIGREEKVTHMWEQYLLEGRAPTKELLPIFARYKTWLTRVYRNIQGLQEQYRQNYGQELVLTDQVRGVFDRILAGDKAMEEALKNTETALPTAKLTPAEAEEAAKLHEEAKLQAEAAVQRLLVKESRVADREYMTAERARLEAEVIAELDADPTYRAIRALEGTLPGVPGQMDRAMVVKEHGAAVADALPKGVLAKDGLPTDVAADFLGFPSGAELVRALVGAEPRADRVKREVGNRMRELYPTLLERPKVLVAAAEGELHNASFLREGIIRLRAMARELGMEAKVPSAAEMADAVKGMIAEMSWSELRPDRFDAAAKAAVGRMSESKDPKLQMAEYETFLLNRALQRSAAEQRTQIEKDQKALRPYTTTEGRAKLGKAFENVADASGAVSVTQPFLEKVDQLLAAFELAPSASKKEVGMRQEQAAALKKWVEERWAMGDPVVVPPSVFETLARKTHWKDMTGAEIHDLRLAVESLAQQATNRTIYRVGEQMVDRETVVIPELLADAAANGAGIEPVGMGGKDLQPLGERIKGTGRAALYSVSRVERLYKQLGPAWKKYLWDVLSDASYRFHDLVRTGSEPVRKMLADLPAAERTRLQTQFRVDGHTYDGGTVISALLNAANESNLSKMLRGNSDPRLAEYGVRPWEGRNTLDAILAHATKFDVELAQKIINAHESYWPAAEAMEKREHGIAPPKIQGKPYKFKGANGVELEGPAGYYPVIYSSRFRIGQEQTERDIGSLLGGGVFDRSYDAASTPQGYLQQRVETYARPVEMTLDSLPRKLVMSAKDIAFRTDAKQVYRLLMDDRIRGALHQAVGVEGYNLLVSHLKDSVNDVMIPDAGAGFWLSVFRRMRREATHAIFALNVPQTMQNLADVAGVKQVVPQGYFMKAGLDITRSQRWDTEAKRFVSPLQIEMLKESGQMRLLADGMKSSLQESLRDTFRKSGVELGWEHAKDLMMIPFEVTNAMTAEPVYLGAKRHGLDQGMSEQAAVRHAEEAVRELFGGRRTVDLTAIQRDQVMRHFTMFWGWAAAQLDIFLGAAHEARSNWGQDRKLKAVGALAGPLALLWAKQLASEALVGKGPGDDEKDGLDAGDVVSWAAWQGVMTVPTKVPVVGTALRSMTGQQSRDVSLTPWLAMVNGLARAGQASVKAYNAQSLTDDQEINLFLAWLEAGGQMVGAPTAQTRATVKYWMGRKGMESPAEDIYRTLYGPKKKSGSFADAFLGE